MPLKTQKLWLGSQDSYQAAVEAQAKAEADPKFSAASDYTDEVTRQILNVQDGVATIQVSGSLVNGSAGYAIFYGVTGYDDIRNAIASAMSNQAVSSILLNVSSGGGHVAGVHELGQLISRAAKVKPIVTYTGSTMASAAVWSTIGASHTIAAETAIVGSIGIIMVHMDRSKQLDEMGIKATTIRAGSDKALASPYEPLSDKAKEHLQTQANTMYSVFIRHVAEAKGVPVSTADTKFGQGKEFIGAEAVKSGLIDAVGTYEDAFMKAMALGTSMKMSKKAAGKGAKASNSGNVQALAGTTDSAMADNQAIQEGTNMPKKSLTQAELEAMAAGVDLTPEASTDQPADKPEDEPAADSSVSAESLPAVTVDALTVVQDLLKTAQADLVTAKMEAKASADALEASKDQLDKFSAIARASLKTMGVHFGLQSDAIAAMDNATVLAEHTRVSAVFKEKFKVGGVAATTQDEVQKPKAAVSPMFAAVLKSTNAK